MSASAAWAPSAWKSLPCTRRSSRLPWSQTPSGETVLDVFGGPGSTPIAAESCGRSARLLEYDPTYCDTIIRRWETHTGKRAPLDADGRTFEGIVEVRSNMPTRRQHTGKRRGTRYRYYMSTSLVTGTNKSRSSGWRIPAGNLEGLVIDRLRTRSPIRANCSIRSASMVPAALERESSLSAPVGSLKN